LGGKDRKLNPFSLTKSLFSRKLPALCGWCVPVQHNIFCAQFSNGKASLFNQVNTAASLVRPITAISAKKDGHNSMKHG
jgi:hypothetical protein